MTMHAALRDAEATAPGARKSTRTQRAMHEDAAWSRAAAAAHRGGNVLLVREMS
jgi:hypothetical protein